MRISTRGRYGLMAMICVAARADESPISLREITQKLELSEKYLEQLLVALRTEGLLKSIKGAYGGYRLNRPAAQITVAEILLATEGKLELIDEDDEEDPSGIRTMLNELLWKPLTDSFLEITESLTLECLLEEWNDRQQGAPMYYI